MDEMSGNWSWSISREKLFWLMLVELSETQSAQGSRGRRRRRRRGWAAPTWTCSCSAPTHSTSTLSTPRHWNCIQHLEHSQLTSGDSCSWAEQLLERQRGSDPTAQSEPISATAAVSICQDLGAVLPTEQFLSLGEQTPAALLKCSADTQGSWYPKMGAGWSHVECSLRKTFPGTSHRPWNLMWEPKNFLWTWQ